MQAHRIRLLVLAALLAWALGAPVAEAQPSAVLDRFAPSETPEDDFGISRASDFGHLRFGAQLHLDYALDPLVYESDLGLSDSEAFSIVGHELDATLGLSFGLADRVTIYAGLPVVLVMEGADAADVRAVRGQPADGPGLSDMYLGARVRLVGEADEIGALALQVTGTFPTGAYEPQAYRSEDHVTLLPELIGELRPGLGSRIALNVGVRIREEETDDTSNLGYSHELTYGLGFAIPVWTDEGDRRTHLDLHAQIYGATAFAYAEERHGTALEAIAGAKLFHASGVVAGLALGPGITRGIGSPDLRVVGQIAWMMPEELAVPEPEPSDRDGDGILDEADGCPDEPEDADAFEDADGCPDPDNDGDGILDAPDQCPNEPETVNEHEDEDGCPDEIGDTDGDGIRDDADQCVDQPEDVDEHEDEDGCPDPDNDGDGVLDTADGCPMEPGPVENRGCPDADRDGDTVVDRLDNCPDEPGTVENHGCQEEQSVVIESDRISILDRVYFRTNQARILRRSFPLLLNVARVLNAHPEIARVVVEGHTDARGDHDHNVQLSQARAEAVVTFLVDEGGMDRARLEARGYGPDRPVVENARSRRDHARNRRVEFHIPSGVEGIQERDQGPSEEAADR